MDCITKTEILQITQTTFILHKDAFSLLIMQNYYLWVKNSHKIRSIVKWNGKFHNCALVWLTGDAPEALGALAGCWCVTDGSCFSEVGNPWLVPHAMTLLSKCPDMHFCPVSFTLSV